MRDHPRDDSDRLARAAGAARELSEAVWDCLQERVAGADPARAQALAERLAEVSATIAALLEAQTRAGGGAGGATDAPVSVDGSVGVGSVGVGGAGVGGAGVGGAGVGRAAEPDARPVITTGAPPARESGGAFDPRIPADPPPSFEAGPPRVERRTPPAPVATTAMLGDSRLVDEQAPTATVTPFAPRSAAGSPQTSAGGREAEIEIRDVRRDEGPSAWISSVGRMLARHGEDRLPFAVLLVEIVDVAHLERSETPHDLHGIVAQVESALGRGMRMTDELSRETLGRYWLLAPETDGAGARMLAERLARLVRGSASHRGAPMEVAIGIAICPDDGVEAPALAARADLGVYSARATGRSIARTEPPIR
jgi:GGDEF domain-containing protein